MTKLELKGMLAGLEAAAVIAEKYKGGATSKIKEEIRKLEMKIRLREWKRV